MGWAAEERADHAGAPAVPRLEGTSMPVTPRTYECVVPGCTEDCRHPREPQHQRRPVPERRPVSNRLGPMAWVILNLVIVFLVSR
jgi:hypothetical protein